MRPFAIAYLASLAILAAVALVGGIVLLGQTAPDSGAEAAGGRHAFNLVAWEARHLPQKWLYELGDLFADQKDGQDDEKIIERYFAVVDDIRDLEQDSAEPSAIAAAEAERAELENVVEDIIEARVTTMVREQGLTVGPPPFTDMQTVLPPVDFELDASPRLLVVSPRDHIARDDGYLLTPGLDLETATGIEDEVETRDDVSALVVQTGGVAAYPSVISSARDYAGLVDTVFHEWLHQHFVMFPLGRSYFNAAEARTLNESVANIAGREFGAAYVERYGDPTRDVPRFPQPSAAPGAFDFSTEMRSLRLEVDELLAAGQIDEAEALMDTKRDYFEDQGVYIRRINQAYFAFFGSYADTPASVDPIGPKLEALFDSTSDLGEFVRLARGITSRADLDQALSEG